MTAHSWFIYLSLVFFATATPGPAILYIMATSTLHGWKKCIYAALGNIIGLLVLGVVAITGLGTILNTSVLVFNAVKYAGAAYLIYLGIRLILEKDSKLSEMNNPYAGDVASRRKIFFQALGIALSNPKAIVFLTALFPQFIIVENALLPQFSTLIATLMFFSFTFLMAYSLMAYKARTWLGTPGRLKIFHRAGGSIFIGFGVLLATSTNK